MSNVQVMKGRYNHAKSTEVGKLISCPTCGNVHTKKTYNMIFCSNGKTKGKGNCKDGYWNVVDEKKRNRKHSKSHYKKYNKEKCNSFLNLDYYGKDLIYESCHPFEGLNDDEYKCF